jgi:hypothetical protein
MRLQPGIGNHFWYRYRGNVVEMLSLPFRPVALVSLVAVLLPMLVYPAFRGWRRSWPAFVLLVSYVFSSWEAQASLFYHYFAQAVPFLIAGAIPYFAGDRERTRMSVAASLAIFGLLGPMVFIGFGFPDRFASTTVASRHRAEARALFSYIPDNASVSVSGMLGAPVAWRAEIHPFPHPMVCPTWFGYQTPSSFATDFVLFESTDSAEQPDWAMMLDAWGYTRLGSSGTIELWKLTSSRVTTEPCGPSASQVSGTQRQH